MRCSCLILFQSNLYSSPSSVIIRGVKTSSDSDAGLACVAYFYFDFKNTRKQDLHALLSSLLVQLSNQSTECFDVLYRLYQAHPKWPPAKPSTDSLVECLKRCLWLRKSKSISSWMPSTSAPIIPTLHRHEKRS